MKGVRHAKAALFKAAVVFAGEEGDTLLNENTLKLAALAYAKEKKHAADKRDQWKLRKRLLEGRS